MFRSSSVLTRFAVISFVAAIALAAAWWFYRETTDPAVVFDRALETMLTTKQVEQHTELSGMSVKTQYDLTKSADPRVMTLLEATQNGRASAVKGYGSLKNVYMAYAETGTPSDQLIPVSLMNHWVQLRQNGTFLPGVTENLMSAADPRFALFGQFIFANASSSRRAELLKLLEKEKVYSYDAGQVKKTTLNSRTVYVYPVKINTDGLAAYNKQAAAIFGLKDADIKLALSGVKAVKEATLYIETGSKQLVRVDVTTAGAKAVTTYSNYNQITLPSEPKREMTYEQYVAKLKR